MNVSILLAEIVAYIDVIVGGNEFAAGAIIAGLMGVATYMSRAVPAKIFELLIKHTTTIMELNSTNESYHQVAAFLHEQGFTNKSRYIKVGNGKWGYGDSVKQIGYGKQIFWIGYTPIMVHSYKEDSQSNVVKEFIKLRKIGRDHSYFDNMITKLHKSDVDDTLTKFYGYQDQCKTFITKQPKKRMENVCIPKDTAKRLFDQIKIFNEKEEWYLKHQIPYQLGILLYGPPGTGKTSLVKAIAAHMDKDICFVSTEGSLTHAAQHVNDAIIVAEDADTLALDKRNSTTKEVADGEPLGDEPEDDVIDSMIRAYDKKTLGAILNALDGVISNHGRVIVLTTNHRENLDPAILRPGRIDIQLEIGHVCSETFNAMLKRFMPDYEEREVQMNKEVTPANLQNDILLGLDSESLLVKYTKQAKTEYRMTKHENAKM